MEFEKINIRGVNFANVTMDETMEIAKSFIAGDKNHAIYTPNAEITQDCISDKTGGLFEIINSADMIIPDGSGVILASKILKTPLKQKVGGYDLGRNHILPYLDEIGGTLFLLGSKEEFAEKAAANLNGQYKNLKVFYHHGWFDLFGLKNPEENAEVVEKINEAKPDVVFVSLGAVGLKQEKWILENKDKVNAKLMIGLGGTIDIIAGAKKYAPKIFIKLHLEWLYYFIRHPSRIKRFMKLPKFVLGTYSARRKIKRDKKREEKKNKI